MKRWTSRAPLVGVLAAAALVQAGALRAPFFADDWLFLDQVRPRGLLASVVSPDPIGNFVRPLGRAAWFWIVGRASGESAFAFHAANLALWTISVGLLWAIARRLAGERVAAVAAALFALTQAADVPVWWACGSQDLLALALALGAVLAFLSGRRWPAALLLFLAPFAKETIAVAAIPAALLARGPRERWSRTLRRAAPLGVALVAWAIVAAGVFARRHAPIPGVALSPWGLPAALYDAARTALGMEWRTGSPPWVPLELPGPLEGAALLLAAVAAGWLGAPAAAPAPASRKAGRHERAAARRGAAGPLPQAGAPAAGSPPHATSVHAGFVTLAWVLPAALPVAFVGPTWSSYYFLFACAGMALVTASWLARLPREGVVAAVLVLGMGMQQARALDEFATAPSPWSPQSHVNRFYLRRGMSLMSELVADLRRRHPTLPPRSTLFFGGIPGFAAFQVGDGPLVRGIYRDTTLRSHYFNDMSSAAMKRGPFFILQWNGVKHEFTDRTLEPDLWLNLGLGYMLGANPSRAEMAFRQDLDRNPGSKFDAYAIALAQSARGDSAGARRALSSLGFGLGRSAEPLLGEAVAQLARGDTARAIRTAEAATVRAVYDSRPHRFLGVLLASDPRRASADGVLEAYAAVVLAPGDAPGWRLWGAIQANYSHETEALQSLERYFELDPASLAGDAEALRWRNTLRDRLPGGRVAQSSLRSDLH